MYDCIVGMKTSGTKAELLHRIQTGEGNPDEMVKSKSVPAPSNEYSNEFVIEDSGKYEKKLVSMTVAELKKICAEKSLKLSGKKIEIIQRIELHDFLLLPISERIPISKKNGDSDSETKNEKIANIENIVTEKIPEKSSNALFRTYDAMSIEYLQDICRSKSLSHFGDKNQLIETLLSDEVEEGSVSENAFVDFYNEGLRSEVPLLTILQPPAKKYREIR